MKQLLRDLWEGEPVLILALIRAAIVFGVTFLAGFTPEQIAAAYGLAEALTAYYTRARVTPV